MVLLGALALPLCAQADGRNHEQQAKKEKTDEKAKKGALQEKQDPAKDLKLQEENLKKLRINAEENKKVGNRAAAWAANQDARHAEKLIKKDKKLLEEGKRDK
ncbi:MAG: hypothetical protein ACXVJ3_17295 [Ilumatobacteraceae bacterium]